MREEVEIEPLTRVEGHGKVRIFIQEGRVERVQLSIFESPRFFEKFLEGIPAEEAPRITGRICGICYVAHNLASVKAVEDAWNVKPPEAAVKLRRLLHVGGYISSHTLHLAFLAMPDLLDIPQRDLRGLNTAKPALLNNAVRLREVGLEVTKVIGGRVIHPVAVVPGGMAKPLTEESRLKLLDAMQNASSLSKEISDLLFEIAESKREVMEEYPRFATYYMGLTNNGFHEIYDGEISVMSPQGKVETEFHPREYLQYIIEETMPHSYVKYPYVKLSGIDKGMYRVGALARLNVADDFSTPLASELLDKYRGIFGRPAHSVAAYNLARSIELVHVTELAIEILRDKDITSDTTRTPVTPIEGTGVGVVEAPRGVLIHHYKTDSKGYIRRANLIVATGHNIPALEESIMDTARKFIPKVDRERALWILEKVVRAYDPCISCATHMVEIVENNE